MIGRFINADKFVSTGQGIIGCNMFAYCGNEPVGNSDPSGKARKTTDDNNDNGIPDYLEEQWIELTNRWRVRLQGGYCRDVTDEVNTALEKATELGKLNQRIPFVLRLIVFKNVVDHNAPWDIKCPNPWKDTIGTEYPGDANSIVIYEGRYYTLEKLGNYTYGVLGKSYCFGLGLLFMGSMKAAGYPKPGTRDYDEEMADWLYIANGYHRGH